MEELSAPFLRYLIPRFKELLGPEYPLDEDSVWDYCTYIVYATVDKIELILDLSEKDYDMCWGLQDTKLFYVSYGDDRLWSIGAKAFYESVIGNMDKIIEGKSKLKMQFDSSHDYDLDVKI